MSEVSITVTGTVDAPGSTLIPLTVVSYIFNRLGREPNLVGFEGKGCSFLPLELMET